MCHRQVNQCTVIIPTASSGDYFTALGIPLREGRFLTSADSHRAERVCVVDEDFARRYWPNGGALGQQVFLAASFSPEKAAIQTKQSCSPLSVSSAR